MKKILFILAAVSSLMLANAKPMVEEAYGASAAGSTVASAREESEDRNQSHADASNHTSCKEVDVSLDEGYGVSRHETRLVCQEIR